MWISEAQRWQIICYPWSAGSWQVFHIVGLCVFSHQSADYSIVVAHLTSNSFEGHPCCMHADYYTPAPRRGWGVYCMKLGIKYQISAIDSCWEKCDEKYLGRTEGRTDGQTDRGKTVYPPPPPIFLSNYWWHKSDIWSQASYRYPISWEAFLDPSDSYFLFADFVNFYTHWTTIWHTYMKLVTKYQISAIDSC
jgi:hypothetical protein